MLLSHRQLATLIATGEMFHPFSSPPLPPTCPAVWPTPETSSGANQPLPPALSLWAGRSLGSLWWAGVWLTQSRRDGKANSPLPSTGLPALLTPSHLKPKHTHHYCPNKKAPRVICYPHKSEDPHMTCEVGYPNQIHGWPQVTALQTRGKHICTWILGIHALKNCYSSRHPMLKDT